MLSLNQRGGNVMTSDEFLVQEVQALAARLSDARASVERRFVGQHEVVEQVLASILAGGHALLIGQPGLGKTMLVDTLSTVLGLDSARIQFTPDLMPADILGSEVLDALPDGSRAWARRCWSTRCRRFWAWTAPASSSRPT